MPTMMEGCGGGAGGIPSPGIDLVLVLVHPSPTAAKPMYKFCNIIKCKVYPVRTARFGHMLDMWTPWVSRDFFVF